MSRGVNEYLEGCSTDVLKNMLFYLSQKDMLDDYSWALPIIKDILRKRENQSSED